MIARLRFLIALMSILLLGVMALVVGSGRPTRH